MDQQRFGRLQEQLRRDAFKRVSFAPWGETDEAEMLAGWASKKGVTVPSGEPVGSVQARVNHSRWLADCPDCAGAMMLREGQTTFVCGNCLNVAVGAPRTVVWPAEDPAPPLNVRPLPDQRNFAPPETVEDLIAENVERGLV